MFWFMLKKLVGAVVLPLPVAMVVMCVGVVVLWRREGRHRRDAGVVAGGGNGWRLRRSGLMAVTVGLGMLWGASLPIVGQLALGALEEEVPCLEDEALPTGVVAVAVLGAGYHPVQGRPLTSALSSHAVARVAEATRLVRLLPEAKLHCSGWGGGFAGSNAEASCALAVALGLSATRTVLHPEAKDTAEEAAAVAAAVPAGRVIVVTDAGHMPRALGLFRAAGVDAVGAPMGHRVAGGWSWWPLPSERALDATTTATHEWLGRVWAAMTR
jgi:uncharacterized SAM-binding protein YcdF (DUF218 family)